MNKCDIRIHIYYSHLKKCYRCRTAITETAVLHLHTCTWFNYHSFVFYGLICTISSVYLRLYKSLSDQLSVPEEFEEIKILIWSYRDRRTDNTMATRKETEDKLWFTKKKTFHIKLDCTTRTSPPPPKKKKTTKTK